MVEVDSLHCKQVWAVWGAGGGAGSEGVRAAVIQVSLSSQAQVEGAQTRVQAEGLAGLNKLMMLLAGQRLELMSHPGQNFGFEDLAHG